MARLSFIMNPVLYLGLKNFKNGKDEGLTQIFYSNGKLKEETNFITGGKKEGA